MPFLFSWPISLEWLHNSFMISLVVAIGFIPKLIYLYIVDKTIDAIQPHNRTITKNECLLTLIPMVGIIFDFVVVNRLSKSLKLEAIERRIDLKEEKILHILGLTFCVLFLVSFLPFFGKNMATIGAICCVIYTIKLYLIKEKLRLSIV